MVYEDFDECLNLACILNDKPSLTMDTPSFRPSSWCHHLPITTWLLLIKCFNGASVAYGSVLSWIPFFRRQARNTSIWIFDHFKIQKRTTVLAPIHSMSILDLTWFLFLLFLTLLSRFSNVSLSISLIIQKQDWAPSFVKTECNIFNEKHNKSAATY